MRVGLPVAWEDARGWQPPFVSELFNPHPLAKTLSWLRRSDAKPNLQIFPPRQQGMEDEEWDEEWEEVMCGALVQHVGSLVDAHFFTHAGAVTKGVGEEEPFLLMAYGATCIKGWNLISGQGYVEVPHQHSVRQHGLCIPHHNVGQDGYASVKLGSVGGVQKTMRLHQLVTWMFYGPPPIIAGPVQPGQERATLEVGHRCHHKWCMSWQCLQWCTHLENMGM